VVHDYENDFQSKARIANEQQNTPSNKSCSSKNVSVISHPIQQPRTTKNFLVRKSKFRNSTDVTQLFQQQHSPFKLIAYVGKLDQESGAT